MKCVKLQWIKRERQRLGIQMHANEMFFIARAIRPPVNFLIFGMGNDSPFWFDLNQIVLRTLSMVQIDSLAVGINFVARVLVVPIG